jgi:replication factor A3
VPTRFHLTRLTTSSYALHQSPTRIHLKLQSHSNFNPDSSSPPTPKPTSNPTTQSNLPYPQPTTTMSETPTTPRITTAYLDQFPNRTVRMVGKVTLLRGEEAKIDCDGEVRILLGRVCFVLFCLLSTSIFIACFFTTSPLHKPDTSEKTHANLHRNTQDAHLQVGNAVEIVGKVNQDLSIKVLRATDFGNNFGMFTSFPTRHHFCKRECSCNITRQPSRSSKDKTPQKEQHKLIPLSSLRFQSNERTSRRDAPI